ncbi:hypothetical protein LI036_05600 [bacterium 210917-DFI.7.65]|nr:hypothetical protein [bacterium 210917-DFI.7.65]
MEASQSIQLKTEQKLVISQRLQQQLAILHMTLQEVAALANEQLQSNPMLEVAEGAEAADSPFPICRWTRWRERWRAANRLTTVRCRFPAGRPFTAPGKAGKRRRTFSVILISPNRWRIIWRFSWRIIL